jgi:hypothetical protein
MKNKVLALVLTSFVGTIAADCNQGHIMVNFDPYHVTSYYDNSYYYADHYGYEHHHHQCLPSERNLRRQLYWLYAYNPRALELQNFPVDYFINSLTDHIRVLEHKIAAKTSGLRSGAMLRGTILAAFASVWGYATHDTYKKVVKGSEPFGAVAMLGAVTAFLTACAGTQFDRVYRHAERMVERLERDIRIRAFLENIKFSNNSRVE